VVDLARAQAHDALVDEPQQLDPPGAEETSDAVVVARGEAVGRGEGLLLADGRSRAALLREGRGDGLQPFGEGFARVLHPYVRGGESAAPRRTGHDAASAQGAAAQPEQPADHGDKQPDGAGDAREGRCEQVVGGVGRHVQEELRRARHDGRGLLREEPHEEDARERQGHGGDAAVVDLGGFGHLVRAGRTEKDRAVELGEGHDGHPADECQRGDGGRGAEHVAARGDAVEEPEVEQHLRDEAVQGRQGADGGRGRQEEDRRQGHVVRHAAQRIERRGAGLREDVARAEEEQRLEERVVEGVEQGPGQTAERHEVVARGLAQRRDAHAEQDDADVLDRGVGQQPLDVVLQRGEDHAPHARNDAQGQQEVARRAQHGQVAQRRDDAQDAVDARLDHHARHEGRDVRRGRRVRLREPDVQREHAGLHAEARQEDEQQRQGRLRAEIFGQGAERRGAARAVQCDEADDEQHEAHVHHDEVCEGRAPHLAPLGVVEDQQERRHGHQLPEEEERVAAVGGDDAQHGQRHDRQRRVVQRDVGRGLFAQRVFEVAAGVEHRGDGADRDEQHEEGREAVHRAAVAAEEGAGCRPER